MNIRQLLSAIILGVGLASCTTTGKLDLSGMSFSDDPLIGKVIWYDLITEDVDGARRFYGDMFGWTFEEATGPEGRNYSVARLGNIYVAGLVPIASRSDGQVVSRWLAYLSVEDVDAALSRAVSAGGEIAVPARNVALGRVAAIIDKDRAVIGLARSKIGDPDDNTTAPAPGKPVWTELLSNDPAMATLFYSNVVGMTASTTERRGGAYTFLSASGRNRAGILGNPNPGWQPLWLTYFGVDDPAAAAARAVALGGKILMDVSPELRGGTMAVIADPSGAVLVLQKLTT